MPLLSSACFLLRQVIIPFPIGFLYVIDKCIIAFIVAADIKSKCGVLPLITHPKAIKPLYLFINLEIITGISKIPGTEMFLKFFIPFFFNILDAPDIKFLKF